MMKNTPMHAEDFYVTLCDRWKKPIGKPLSCVRQVQQIG